MANLSTDGQTAIFNQVSTTGETVLSFAKTPEMVELLRGKLRPTEVDIQKLSHRLQRCNGDGQLEEAQVRLVLEAQINIKIDIGDNALIRAACDGKEPLVKALLTAGGDPGIHGKSGLIASSWAAKLGHIKILKILLASMNPAVLIIKKEKHPLHYPLSIYFKSKYGLACLQHLAQHGDMICLLDCFLRGMDFAQESNYVDKLMIDLLAQIEWNLKQYSSSEIL